MTCKPVLESFSGDRRFDLAATRTLRDGVGSRRCRR